MDDSTLSRPCLEGLSSSSCGRKTLCLGSDSTEHSRYSSSCSKELDPATHVVRKTEASAGFCITLQCQQGKHQSRQASSASAGSSYILISVLADSAAAAAAASIGVFTTHIHSSSSSACIDSTPRAPAARCSSRTLSKSFSRQQGACHQHIRTAEQQQAYGSRAAAVILQLQPPIAVCLAITHCLPRAKAVSADGAA